MVECGTFGDTGCALGWGCPAGQSRPMGVNGGGIAVAGIVAAGSLLPIDSWDGSPTVSYTHLTLPTILRV